MEIRLSAHGAYHHEYHLVWIPKYRRRVLTGPLKDFLAQKLGEICEYHPCYAIARSRLRIKCGLWI